MFNKFAMSDNEIRESWANAENQKEHIQVLADLNVCSRREIATKLIELELMPKPESPEIESAKESPNAKAAPWSEEDIRVLNEMLAEKKTYFEIANRLGRTRSAVAQYINKHIRGTKPSPAPAPRNPKKEPANKPPIGIEPKSIWLEKRKDDLRDAVIRYLNAGLSVSPEWIEEYNGILGAASF